MKKGIATLLLAAVFGGVAVSPALAQGGAAETQTQVNRIEKLETALQGSAVFVKLTLQAPLDAVPASFSVANPARIAFDFPATANGLGHNVQTINQGELRSANIVQVGDRTRLVLNLTRMAPFETRIEGRELIIALNPVGQADLTTITEQPLANFAASSQQAEQAVKSVRDD